MSLSGSDVRIAVDIGSTVVKVALLADDDSVISQQFYPRDFEAGILAQVTSLLFKARRGKSN